MSSPIMGAVGSELIRESYLDVQISHLKSSTSAKNSRLLSEFREIDSYLTDSESESDDTSPPSLAQKQLDNSVLRMGKSLLDAARANPIEGTTETPKVTLRLTRLDPNLINDDGTEPDARIAQTLERLHEMGIDVQLGERSESELPPLAINSSIERPSSPFIPTLNINLDLSILIALISDLSHAPLPASVEDANKRFLPPQEYREWKKQKMADNPKPPRKYKSTSTQPTQRTRTIETDINDLPNDLIKHSRALTNQLLQEMGRGLLQEMHDRISASYTEEDRLKVTFWTTPEARDRCLRIISKIGGIHEKRRAHALFCYDTAKTGGCSTIPLDEAIRLYWQDSRFKPNFIPLLPIHLYPTSSVPANLIPGPSSISSLEISIPRSNISSFAKSLDIVCAAILSQETMAEPRALPDEVEETSMFIINSSAPSKF